MNDHHPPISVVMPSFNDGPYLRQSIDSILNQSFTDFEFIIVNDGSTDDTEEIILSYSDRRIKYLKNETNTGNTNARNRGMQTATGKYIAIMDSDDISVPDRFQLQYDYLEKHPEIGILGGSKIFFDEHQGFKRYYPSNPQYIKSFLFFKNAVGQPTVMMRREILNANHLFYNPDYENAEDFELWYRAAIAGVKIANLDAVMLYYRQSESQMSHITNLGERPLLQENLFKKKLKQLDINLEVNEFIKLHHFIKGRVNMPTNDYLLLKNILTKIELANIKYKKFNIKNFSAVLFSHRLRLLKYHFLERGKYIQFCRNLLILALKTGFYSLLKFWGNEGKYFGSFGVNKGIYRFKIIRLIISFQLL